MDSFILVLRVVLSLGAVLTVLWLAQKYARRRLKVGGSEQLVSVVARQGIGQKAAVVLVDADGKRFLLGVTEQSVSILHTADAPEVEETDEEGAAAFSRKLAEASGEKASAAGAAAAGAPAAGPLAGSILAPSTW
ncbi:flagellar biosynthesis protein FliO, partial [Arthrobacter crystallopoietes BAB-32]